jgi:hypothetical protein
MTKRTTSQIIKTLDKSIDGDFHKNDSCPYNSQPQEPQGVTASIEKPKTKIHRVDFNENEKLRDEPNSVRFAKNITPMKCAHNTKNTHEDEGPTKFTPLIIPNDENNTIQSDAYTQVHVPPPFGFQMCFFWMLINEFVEVDDLPHNEIKSNNQNEPWKIWCVT